jgi:chemotaxis protein CheZ
MVSRNAHKNLLGRLESLQEERGGGFNIDAVAHIVEEAVTSALKRTSDTETGVRAELEQVSQIIRSAKAEIANLKPEDVKSDFLPAASDELDAIIEATEVATDEIMSAAEKIDAIGSELGGDNEDKLADLTVQIYTACGFQDITGQRITKVVGALKNIETRVDELISALNTGGKKGRNSKAPKKTPKKKAASRAGHNDNELLEGPQHKDTAIKQENIDALLADFD